jgi:hypothetical protein
MQLVKTHIELGKKPDVIIWMVSIKGTELETLDKIKGLMLTSGYNAILLDKLGDHQLYASKLFDYVVKAKPLLRQ